MSTADPHAATGTAATPTTAPAPRVVAGLDDAAGLGEEKKEEEEEVEGGREGGGGGGGGGVVGWGRWWWWWRGRRRRRRGTESIECKSRLFYIKRHAVWIKLLSFSPPLSDRHHSSMGGSAAGKGAPLALRLRRDQVTRAVSIASTWAVTCDTPSAPGARGLSLQTSLQL